MPLIELYTRPTCVLCQTTKKQLNERNINYIEHQVDKDITRDEVLAKFPEATTLPVVVVDGVMVRDPSQFQMLLEG